MFSGITSLKPTAGRVPVTGQGSDGGIVGVVGLHNTIGFMARWVRRGNVIIRNLIHNGKIWDDFELKKLASVIFNS
jgi:hypothetical protein